MDVTLRKIEKIQSYQNDTYSKYYWCRRKFEYLTRLFYAIMVDIIIQSNPQRVNKALFEVRSGSLGTFSYFAQKLLSALPPEQKELFKAVWDELASLKNMRNNDAHPGTAPEDLETFIMDINHIFDKLIHITQSKFFTFSKDEQITHSYLIMPESADLSESDSIILCKSIVQEGDAVSKSIFRNNLIRGNDTLANQVYLMVTAGDNFPEYYRISPFINWENNEPTMFMGAVQFWTDEVTFEHMPIVTSDSKNNLSFLSCTLKSLIPKSDNKNNKFNPLLSRNSSKRIEINISNYPGYSSVTQSTFNYCKEICPAVEEAVDFCKNRTDTYQVVCGEGGVGKTTLIFHLIHDVILKGETQFTRVIFLSAKKYFHDTDHTLEKIEQDRELTPDIHHYQEFLERLAFYLLDDDINESEAMGLEDALLSKINGNNKSEKTASIPFTFLVVDDLDSLTPDDQENVVSFLKRIRKKMNALITTRNEKTNGYKIRLSLLNKNDSMKFLEWCIEQKQPGDGKQLCDLQDPDLVYYFTEGRPIALKSWGNLLMRNLNVPKAFGRFWTIKQKTIYLYQTTLIQLTHGEQELYQLVCSITDALYPGEKDSDKRSIHLPLLFYLYPDKSKEEINQELHELKNVNLLRIDNESLFIENIDYSELIRDAKLSPLPDGMLSIIEYMGYEPEKWISQHFVSRLIQYLNNQISSGGNKEYECGILQRISEDQNNLRKQERDLLNEVLQQLKNSSSLPASGSIAKANNIVPNGEQDLYSSIEQLLEQIMQISSTLKEGNFDDNEISSKVHNIGKAINQLERYVPIQDISASNKIQELRKAFFGNGLHDFLD